MSIGFKLDFWVQITPRFHTAVARPLSVILYLFHFCYQLLLLFLVMLAERVHVIDKKHSKQVHNSKCVQKHLVLLSALCVIKTVD